jgi:DNA-binding CsgD family transcriptional regulator
MGESAGFFDDQGLATLTSDDLLDVLDIVHTANCGCGLLEMRTNVCMAIKRAFQASAVVFFLGDKEFKAIDNTSLAGVNADPRYLESWAACYYKRDPFHNEAHGVKEVCKVDDILPHWRWEKLKIYKEFYKPQNIHHKFSMFLNRQDKVFGAVGVFRSREQEDFSKHDMTKARILVPHLVTAIENRSCAFGNEGGDLCAGLVNRFPLFGVIALDYSLRPLRWNAEALDFCRALTDGRGTSAPGMGTNPVIIPEIVQDCLKLKALHQNGEGLPPFRWERIISAGVRRRFRVISSLESRTSPDPFTPGFNIYLFDVSEKGRLDKETLKARYRLTGREADIVLCVWDGLTNSEIGDMLFISRNTVETHLKKIFSKTMIKHRAGLARLLKSS